MGENCTTIGDKLTHMEYFMLDNSQFKILIVDDEEFNIEVVVGFLEDEKYNLSYVSSGESALHVAFEHSFDLILLDINMPGMNGLEVCKRLKKDRATKDIPIIFLSALNDIDTIAQAFSVGGVDYLSKPFNGLELIARVKTHIQLQKYIRELISKQEKLAQLASTDTQTGLANRIRFTSILKSKCAKIKTEPSRLSLAYVKLDSLQKINDIYGYKSGDKIIKKIANLLQDNTQDKNTVARLFGTDFVVIMPNTSLEASLHLMKKVLDKIRASNFLEVKVTCSIGLAEFKIGESHELFLLRAERIMEQIKHNGGNMISSELRR